MRSITTIRGAWGGQEGRSLNILRIERPPNDDDLSKTPRRRWRRQKTKLRNLDQS
jgi:hypothetical protein